MPPRDPSGAGTALPPLGDTGRAPMPPATEGLGGKGCSWGRCCHTAIPALGVRTSPASCRRLKGLMALICFPITFIPAAITLISATDWLHTFLFRTDLSLPNPPSASRARPGL